jgi:hypothetical protein
MAAAALAPRVCTSAAGAGLKSISRLVARLALAPLIAAHVSNAATFLVDDFDGGADPRFLGRTLTPANGTPHFPDRPSERRRC